MSKYYIVSNEILPDVLDQVVEARELLQSGAVRKISQTVKAVGISRGTYYKYKDHIFLPSKGLGARKAIISMMLEHRSGILSKVLDAMSEAGTNIITINQNIPIHEVANVVISFDMSEMAESMERLLERLMRLEGVASVRLDAVE